MESSLSAVAVGRASCTSGQPGLGPVLQPRTGAPPPKPPGSPSGQPGSNNEERHGKCLLPSGSPAVPKLLWDDWKEFFFCRKALRSDTQCPCTPEVGTELSTIPGDPSLHMLESDVVWLPISPRPRAPASRMWLVSRSSVSRGSACPAWGLDARGSAPPAPRACVGLGPGHPTSGYAVPVFSAGNVPFPCGRQEAALFVDRGCGSLAVRNTT